jgi:murein DD-endopeptidase MepM/ murein hydrolase activator NlpD
MLSAFRQFRSDVAVSSDPAKRGQGLVQRTDELMLVTSEQETKRPLADELPIRYCKSPSNSISRLSPPISTRQPSRSYLRITCCILGLALASFSPSLAVADPIHSARGACHPFTLAINACPADTEVGASLTGSVGTDDLSKTGVLAGGKVGRAALIEHYETQIETMAARHREAVFALEAENARLAADRSAVFAELKRQTQGYFVSAMRIITQTGLNADDLLASAGFGNAGLGGPFLTAHSAPDFETSAANVPSLGELAALRRVMKSLPLAAPLKEYRITSRYGSRRDPFNGRRAMHAGIDLSAPYAAPIFATAPGTVVAAGRWGGYGLAIEIQHGAGITTRFGHLSRLLVKEGQQVAFGEKIGRVGSSGRSTGPHLHYEIRYESKTKDPLAFIRAGDDVFQDEVSLASAN